MQNRINRPEGGTKTSFLEVRTCDPTQLLRRNPFISQAVMLPALYLGEKTLLSADRLLVQVGVSHAPGGGKPPQDLYSPSSTELQGTHIPSFQPFIYSLQWFGKHFKVRQALA